jgi:hypothetical protein
MSIQIKSFEDRGMGLGEGGKGLLKKSLSPFPKTSPP